MYRLTALFRKHRTRLLVAACITLFGLILRVNMALNGPVEWDEPVYLNAAVEYAGAIRGGDLGEILTSTYNYEHPIFYKLVYAAVLSVRRPAPDLDSRKMIAGSLIRVSPFFNRFFALRFVSVVFGSLAVFLLALLNPLAGLFLAFNTYTLKYTSVLYLEALPLALSLAGVIAYNKARAWLSPGCSSHRPLGWLAFSAVCLGLAAASKYIYGLAAVAITLDMLVLSRRAFKTVFKTGLLWAGLVLITFLAADPVILVDPAGRIGRSVAYSVNYSQTDDAVKRAGYPFWQPLSWLAISITRQPIGLEPFFIQPGNYWLAIDEFLLPLALLGSWQLGKKHPVFALWLVVGLAFLLAWNTKWPQYILAIMPPFCLSAGLGLTWASSTLWDFILHFRNQQQSP